MDMDIDMDTGMDVDMDIGSTRNRSLLSNSNANPDSDREFRNANSHRGNHGTVKPTTTAPSKVSGNGAASEIWSGLEPGTFRRYFNSGPVNPHHAMRSGIYGAIAIDTDDNNKNGDDNYKAKAHHDTTAGSSFTDIRLSHSHPHKGGNESGNWNDISPQARHAHLIARSRKLYRDPNRVWQDEGQAGDDSNSYMHGFAAGMTGNNNQGESVHTGNENRMTTKGNDIKWESKSERMGLDLSRVPFGMHTHLSSSTPDNVNTGAADLSDRSGDNKKKDKDDHTSHGSNGGGNIQVVMDNTMDADTDSDADADDNHKHNGNGNGNSQSQTGSVSTKTNSNVIYM